MSPAPVPDDVADHVVDVGVTSVLDPLIGEGGPLVRRLLDARAGLRVDDAGVAVRRPLRTRRLSWEQIDRVELDNRLDRLVGLGTQLLPAGRLPVVGDVVVRTVRSTVGAATRAVVPGLRDRAGWVLATFVHGGDEELAVGGVAGVTALLSPRLTEVVERQAAAHDVPVERRTP